MKKERSTTYKSWADLSPDLRAQLHAAAAMPDAEIDLTDPDAPEQLDWSGAVRGKFYKPVKALKSLRLDADVVAWFQSQGPGYQTRMNEVLRQAMLLGLRSKGQRSNAATPDSPGKRRA